MPATYTAEVLNARAETRVVKHAPNSAAADRIVDLGQPSGGAAKLVAIAQFRRFRATLYRHTGVGTTTKFAIFAATDSAGTGAVDVITHGLGGANKPAAVGDNAVLEVDASMIREVLATATHVGVRTTQGTAGDEGAVMFERGDPYFPHTGLTADFLA